MKVTKDNCVILPGHELADSYPRLQSALPRRRVELMKTRSPRVEPQTYHVTVSISLDDARSTCPSAPAWVAAVRHKGIFGGASSPSRALVEANEQRLGVPNFFLIFFWKGLNFHFGWAAEWSTEWSPKWAAEWGEMGGGGSKMMVKQASLLLGGRVSWQICSKGSHWMW